MKQENAIDCVSTSQLDQSFAIVTASFLPDLARCELLSESLDHCAPSVPHYLIVDRQDRLAFAHLERGRRRVIESESIVGDWIWRMPFRKGFWFSLKAPPVRGWIIQQILKIGAAEVIPERTSVFCDSDTAFFRQFNRDDLLVNGKIGLHDVPFVNDNVRRWTASARRLLGLPAYDGGYHNYVGNMICWNRETVRAMQKRIETTRGTDWQVALARKLSFSEYMIYGVFVREALKFEGCDHAPSTVPLVKGSWGAVLTTDRAIDDFFADFDPQTVAVMIHSKDGVDPRRYRGHLERFWKSIDRGPVSSARALKEQSGRG